MNEINKKYFHLSKNLDRIVLNNSIFNYSSGRKAFLSLGKGSHEKWLKNLLPNTRLIIEPKLIGKSIALSYEKGKLEKAINALSNDISEPVKKIKNIPKQIPIKRSIQIRGVLYSPISSHKGTNKLAHLQAKNSEEEKLNFCAFQIFHCKLNHFQSLQELKKIDFEIPHTRFTHYISDVEMYRELWREGKLFENYPTNGIVLKINSRKFQKYLGENNVSINWAYAIKN